MPSDDAVTVGGHLGWNMKSSKRINATLITLTKPGKQELLAKLDGPRPRGPFCRAFFEHNGRKPLINAEKNR